jgi:hypothetical protein
MLDHFPNGLFLVLLYLRENQRSEKCATQLEFTQSLWSLNTLQLVRRKAPADRSVRRIPSYSFGVANGESDKTLQDVQLCYDGSERLQQLPFCQSKFISIVVRKKYATQSKFGCFGLVCAKMMIFILEYPCSWVQHFH